MKSFFKWFATAFTCLSLLFLVACSNVSQSYADKRTKDENKFSSKRALPFF